MSSEKDRLGEKLHDVEAAREDQWAKQRDAELLKQMKEKLAASMSCPKCKKKLEVKELGGVEIFACPQGEGAWVELEALEQALKRMK